MDVRGSILQSICDFLLERYGAGNYSHWVSQLPSASKSHFERKIGPNEWYPLTEAMVVPVQSLLDTFYGGLTVGARALGFYNAEKALTGFLKFVVRRGSPAFIIRQASSIMQKYYNPCETTVAESTNGHAVIHVTRFDEPHLIIDYRIQGWMEKALEVSGCSDIRIEITKSMARGDELTEFVGTWK